MLVSSIACSEPFGQSHAGILQFLQNFVTAYVESGAKAAIEISLDDDATENRFAVRPFDQQNCRRKEV